MQKIPKCMSTQHPDNVNIPFFAENSELGGEDEIQEAYYAYSHLGCDEQMWDCEGKEVDNYVVKKLLTKYETYFNNNKLGKDIFLTLRVPNPKVEKAEAKILLETLDSIPRSFDAAKAFYNEDVPPIIEIILPMTQSASCIDRIYRYYADFIVGKQKHTVRPNDIKIADWIGEFKPEKINVIPLFEDLDQMLNSPDIVWNYLQDKDVEYQRVFLARSDPAMNYGLISAVLLNKMALQRLSILSEKTGVSIYPIIGVGSAPFRGNLRPQTVNRVLEEYPSAHTFTIQSAFKYDNTPNEVQKAIKDITNKQMKPTLQINEIKYLEQIKKYLKEYQKQILELAPIINKLAKYIPSRRKRKLHIGLFGYSRNLNGNTLPRAITFTSSLYSIGLPPEILGLNALNESELQEIKEAYINFENDINDSLSYFNPDTPFLPSELKKTILRFSNNYEINLEHKKQTDFVIDALKHEKNGEIQEYILEAANIRKFLG